MAHTLKITTPGDREIAMTRVFDAPRTLVWDACTKPELLQRWLGVQNGWTLAVCEVDFRVGGSYRYVWRSRKGKDMGASGTYREIVPPERLVSTENFDDPWYTGEAVNTMTLVERAGRTTMTTTTVYESRDARDEVLRSPMESGVAASYDKLDEMLTATSV
jgi:uncharacterized protein YndB with AHSA1/START domain